MPQEIERRFLVTELRQAFVLKADFDRLTEIEQGYFELGMPLKSFRVRISNRGSAEITLKEGRGLARDEKPHPISLELGKDLISTSHHQLGKIRYEKKGWEVDLFKPPLTGIILAEFEKKADSDRIPTELPSWIGKGIDVTETLTNLHLARLATLLLDSNTPALPIILERIGRKIVRIALTGAPCSGKTGIIRILKSGMPQVRFLPETASVVMGQIGIKPGNTLVSQRRFQQMLYRTQDIFETTSLEMSLEDNVRAWVFDRGKVDNAAYLAGGLDEFEKLLRTGRSAEYSQYDAVIYLEEPPREIFEREKRNNPSRLENNYEEILALADRTRAAWEAHPNFIFIPNGASWEEKVDAARNAVCSLIQSR